MDFHKRETKTASKFTQCYLRRDGLLIVRLIGELYCFSFASNIYRNIYGNLVVGKQSNWFPSGKNAGHLVAAELLHGLWTNYGPDRRSMAESQGEAVTPSPRLITNELV